MIELRVFITTLNIRLVRMGSVVRMIVMKARLEMFAMATIVVTIAVLTLRIRRTNRGMFAHKNGEGMYMNKKYK